MKDAPPPDPLPDRLGYLLKQAYLRIAADLGEALAPHRINPRELGVMAAIEAGRRESSQMEIAELIGMDRTSMVGMIDALQAKGYVERRRSELDRRRNVVTLTPAGERTLAEAERARVQVERAFLAPLDPAAAATLTEALAALHRAHGRDPAESAPPHCAGHLPR